MPNPKLKWCELSGNEVARLFDAISFSMWRDGPAGLFTCCLTIAWATLGVTDHQQAARLLGRFVDGARKWARIGGPDHRPDRRRWRSRVGEGFAFRYVFTHENSGVQGFHSNLLATVPAERYQAFAVWARQILPRLAQHPGTKATLYISHCGHRAEPDQVLWQWRMFKYIAKQCDPRAQLRYAKRPREPAVVLRDLLQLNPYQSALPVTCAILSGISRDLRGRAMDAAGYRNWLGARREQLYTGQELETFRDRQRVAYFERAVFPVLEKKI
jgi:hypothetical protein